MKKTRLTEKQKKLLKDRDKYLLSLGFNKVWLDDKSGYWHEFEFSHNFIDMRIIVDENKMFLDVSCYSEYPDLSWKEYEIIHVSAFSKTMLDQLRQRFDIPFKEIKSKDKSKKSKPIKNVIMEL